MREVVPNKKFFELFSDVQRCVCFVPFPEKLKKMELRDFLQYFQQTKLHTQVVGFFQISPSKIPESTIESL